MTFPKRTRAVDKTILQKYRDMPCIICSRTPSDPAHIKTRGSGGDDLDENLMALCRIHHAEQHNLGFYRFCEKYPLMQIFLARKGWTFESKRLKRV